MRALVAAALFFASLSAHAAVSCTLDSPDRDVKRLVKEATTYKVRELLPFRQGRKGLLQDISRELESPLDPEYETPETPYTFYAVYKGIEQVALIFGINARAVAGPMQLFVVYEKSGKIRDVYVQKISSSDAPEFRSKYYRQQYARYGLNAIPGEADIKPPERSPSNDVIRDHEAFLRAIKLNILLVRELYNKQS